MTALKAADYFTGAALADGHPLDPRAESAIAVLREKRQPDGTWLQDRRYPGRVWFELDVPAGEPSKWVTFLALRALRRADGGG